MSDFEHELKKQPLRRVPSYWRVEILAAAAVAKPVIRKGWQWRDLLWPSPKAWGALAASWVLIICFNIATRETTSDATPETQVQMRMAVEQKRNLQAEIEEA